MVRVFKHYIGVYAIVLATVEAFLFFVLLLVGEAARNWYRGLGFDIQPSNLPLTFMLAAVSFLVMAALGLYNRQVVNDLSNSLKHALPAFPLIFVAQIIYLFIYSRFVDVNSTYYQGILIVVLPAAFIVFFALRGFAMEILPLRVFRRQVLVLGTGDLAIRIAQLFQRAPRHHFSIFGFIRTGEIDCNEPPEEVRPVLPVDLIEERGALKRYVLENGIDEIVFASRERRRSRSNDAFGLPVWELLECKLAGVKVTDYASFWEREAGELDLDELRPGWLLLSDGFRIATSRRVFKRLFDVTVSLLILIFSLPLTILAALLVKVTSPGPIFYRQERVGLDGETFEVLKFRSMRTDAEKNGPQFATKSDPRVTPIGRFIRMTRIDEIPQVINVLKGDMSFIGPRPERPVFVGNLSESIPFYGERHAVKPGISGWAQINYPYGDSTEDAKRKLAFDLYYVKNGSTFLDLLILLQTIRVVLFPSAGGAR